MPPIVRFYSKQNAGIYIVNQWSEAGILGFHDGNYFINADFRDLDVFYVGY